MSSKKSGRNIHVNKRIPFNHAMCGGSLSFDGPDGQKMTVFVPAGTQPNDIIKIENAGISESLSEKKGDMIVHLEVFMPRYVSSQARVILNELVEEINKSPLNNS